MREAEEAIEQEVEEVLVEDSLSHLEGSQSVQNQHRILLKVQQIKQSVIIVARMASGRRTAIRGRQMKHGDQKSQKSLPSWQIFRLISQAWDGF